MFLVACKWRSSITISSMRAFSEYDDAVAHGASLVRGGEHLHNLYCWSVGVSCPKLLGEFRGDVEREEREAPRWPGSSS